MAKTSFNCPDSREIVSFCVNLQRGHKTDVIFHNLQEEGNVGHQDIPSVRRCCCMLAQTAAAGELRAQAQPSHARHFCGDAGMGALQPGLTRLTLKSHFLACVCENRQPASKETTVIFPGTVTLNRQSEAGG